MKALLTAATFFLAGLVGYTQWDQVGNNIYGSPFSVGYGTCISMPDPNTVAVSRPGDTSFVETESTIGLVQVYKWNGSVWLQKGEDILGKCIGDEFGCSISMPDSNTIAIGARRNDTGGENAGHVKVFSWNGIEWMQKGGDIKGDDAYDYLGWAVSMPEPDVLAVSAPINGGLGTQIGYVRVFDWDGTRWRKRGSDIDGLSISDHTGYSIHMPNKNTIAVGSPDGNGITVSGLVRVFEWNDTSWTQKGSIIHGMKDKDRFGATVSMANANYISIGAPKGHDHGNDSGYVEVYRWDSLGWLIVGGQIKYNLDQQNQAHFGTAVSMGSPNVVAIGAPWDNPSGMYGAGMARVYYWSEDQKNWIQLGEDFLGDMVFRRLGFSVYMSGENCLAISACSGFKSQMGQLMIYTWNNSKWILKGKPIQGKLTKLFGHAISMPDSTTIGIGAPESGNKRIGSVYVKTWRNYQWEQKGDLLEGGENFENFGYSISMPDPRTIGIGSPFESNYTTHLGLVRIYKWDGLNWSQKGSDISGKSYKGCAGNSISMPDSTTIAIGEPFEAFNSKPMGGVRVYSWDGSIWRLKGSNIRGFTENTNFGHQVTMPDNNTIGIVASGENGFVAIYEYVGTDWSPKGKSLMINANSLSMPNSNTLAIGAPGSSNEVMSGKVFVYTWDGIQWVQKGLIIEGDSSCTYFGYSVEMPNENTIAVGQPGRLSYRSDKSYVHIYLWNGINWIKAGKSIVGQDLRTMMGSSISMPVSDYLAVGAPRLHSEGLFSGTVRVYNSSPIIGIDPPSSTRTTIYPNPTQREILIDLGRKAPKVTITIYNSIGQLQHKSVYYSRKVIPVLIDGTSGIYLVKIQYQNEESEVFKLFKVK